MNIKPAKYNGINFCYDINRESLNYNFDFQRKKSVISTEVQLDLSFHFYSETEAETANLYIIGDFDPIQIPAGDNPISFDYGFIYFFTILPDVIPQGDVRFEVFINNYVSYSEFCRAENSEYLAENEICIINAYNADNRHGYFGNGIFGFFKFSKLKSDIFIKKSVEYEHSYGRKKILSSENQIVKRFTFLDLTMYEQNLLKWLCNCENFTINGTTYNLISDFAELEADLNSEILNLQADFVEVYQSFFSESSTSLPKAVFNNVFFMH